LHLSYCRRRRRAGDMSTCLPSRFIAELAQDDLRYADTPLTGGDAEKEKAAGSERLKSLKAMLTRP
jgi:ATP-dependent DNA helicase Rep